MNLAHELEIGFAVKLACANFMGIGADDDGFVSGDQAALKLDGFAEMGMLIIGIFVGEDECVGRDDVVFPKSDVECAGDEIGKTGASCNQGHDRVEIGCGHAIAGGDGAEEEFHDDAEEGNTMHGGKGG